MVVLRTPPNFGKQIYNMVGLAEVVLDVVVLGRDAQLDELVLECAALLKEAVYFTIYLHFVKIKNPPTLTGGRDINTFLHPKKYES